MIPWSIWKDIFQSTLPHRERLARYMAKKSVITISIHAPAQGATAAFPE